MKKVINYSKIYDQLISEIKTRKYTKDEYERFSAELGWEDWMEDFTDEPEGEPATECESEDIDRVIREAWEEVFGK